MLCITPSSVGRIFFAAGAYDEATGVLTHDAQIKVYEVKPGLSPALGSALSLPAGPSFHFVLNNVMIHDERIPLISATGSVRMGRHVGTVVAQRLGRSLLELGGNNALLSVGDEPLATGP